MKNKIETESAPKALGTYSQAIDTGNTISISYTHLTLPTKRIV